MINYYFLIVTKTKSLINVTRGGKIINEMKKCNGNIICDDYNNNDVGDDNGHSNDGYANNNNGTTTTTTNDNEINDNNSNSNDNDNHNKDNDDNN